MIPVVSLLASLVMLLVVLLGPGIAAEPCREHEIRIDGQAPSALSPDSSVFDVVDAVAALMRNKLDLKLPAWRKAYVCRDEAAFSEGLLRNFGARTWHGSETSAAGIATSFGVFLRGDYLARRTLAGRVEVIAHELAHLIQQELARPRVHEVPRWIVEGHAEWVALSVVDRLGYGSYSERRAQVARSVVDGAIPATLAPGLDTLDSPDQWWRWTRSLSPSVTYGQAFLAVDRLTERYGSATMVEFFRAFARATDARECWDGLFPISYPQFVADFRTHLRSLGPADDQGHPLGQR
jgi:hypothetical protein